MKDNILEIRNKILSLVNDYSNINFKEKEFIPGDSDVPDQEKLLVL